MHPKHLLDRHGIEPKKSLGQNFLHDEGLLARIVAAAAIGPEDEVLEIGPGLGALTKQLAAAARRVVAVELDNRLLPVLESELAGAENVEIVHADILELDPVDWFAGPYKVVANVPYYITGAILRHLLSGRPKPSTLVLTVQREVADRLVARPPEMSLLSVSVGYYGRARLVGTVKAGAFWPRPEVDSAIVRIDVDARSPGPDGGRQTTDRSQPEAPSLAVASGVGTSSSPSEEQFFRVVRAGFSEKRKQLKNNLRQVGVGDEAIAAALEAAGIDGRRRAETLTVEEWGRLAERLG
jgi:16S rRNA (adenine1518-N6/adenine1519-N6)-dimethyltransferase